ncbi:hypothetical protein F5Y12DRAFT_717548 [Xylaria sp. FL1777]|nr:hypothetical protein F5Y12DRAFT_717548 [Xylaria sp. FL1777]
MVLQQESIESSHNFTFKDSAQNGLQHGFILEDTETQEDDQILAPEPLRLFRSNSQCKAHPVTAAFRDENGLNSRSREFPGDVDRQSTDLGRLEKELQQELYDKDALQKDLEETRDNLERTVEKLQRVEKLWKKTASQLDQLQSKGARMHQLSDSEVIGLVMQLRYAIRNFSLQYFEEKAPQQSREAPINNLINYMPEISGLHDYHDYLLSETKGPIIIQSFLWSFLVGEIFEKFCWVPSLRDSVAKVYMALRPVCKGADYQEVSIQPDAEQKFQNWKATTSALILKSMEEKESLEMSYDVRKNFVCNISTRVLDVIRPFARKEDKILDSLQVIIEQAIALDENICMLEASFDWRFIHSGRDVLFNPEFMEIDLGEILPRSKKYVDVVRAPALVKRGRHIGKNPWSEDWLLKMNVTCVPLSRT